MFYAACPIGYLKWGRADLPIHINVKQDVEADLNKCARKCNRKKKCGYFTYGKAVSYTHLTLPTNREV